MATQVCMTPAQVELSNTLRRLWMEHVLWTRAFIESTFADSGDLEQVTEPRNLRRADIPFQLDISVVKSNFSQMGQYFAAIYAVNGIFQVVIARASVYVLFIVDKPEGNIRPGQYQAGNILPDKASLRARCF